MFMDMATFIRGSFRHRTICHHEVKFQLDFAAGIFIELLKPPLLLECLKSAMLPPRKNLSAENQTGSVARNLPAGKANC